MPKAKPVQLLEFGNGHHTKGYLESRRRNEIRIGGKLTAMPESVRGNPIAAETWEWLADLYDGFTFVDSSDSKIIESYCFAYSEWRDLVRRRDQLCADEYRDQMIAWADQDWDLYQAANRTDEILKIDAAIDRRLGQLNQLSDRLFLNPRTRVQSVPKQAAPPKETPLDKAGFGGV